MARKKPLEKISDMADQDLRLRALGFFAVGIWHALMRLVLEHGHDGRLAFGRGRMPSLSDIARIRFDMSEAEFITQLITQSKSELIYWDAASGTVGWPAELMPDARTLANRANGKKGGRPPKNTNPTPQRDPRQRTAMMPIAGGKTMAEEHFSKTQTETSSRVASLASNISFEDKAKLEPKDVDQAFQRIGPKAFREAGFDEVRNMNGWGIVRDWVAEGMRQRLPEAQIETVILGAIQRVKAQYDAKERAKPIGTLKYFNGGVRDDLREAVPDVSPVDRAVNSKWLSAVDEWRQNGMVGSMPQRSDFLGEKREAA
ncbi:hypothetical protein [Asaia sp. HN128]